MRRLRPAALGLALVWSATLAGCSHGAGPMGVPDDAPLVRSLAGEHFDYRFAAGDTILPREARINDRAYEIIRDALATDFSRRIAFDKFVDADHIQRLTGRRTGGGFVVGGKIFLTRALDPHEIAHVIAIEELGRPSDFFDEGLAVNFGGVRVTGDQVEIFPSALRNFEIDAEVRSVFAGGRFPGSVREILTSGAFQALPFEVSYPVAGSFVKFLLHTRGLPALRTFFASSAQFDASADIEADLLGAFGAPIQSLESEWRSSLGLPEAAP